MIVMLGREGYAMGNYVNLKKIIMQLLVVLILLGGGAEAKGIEAGLWGIGWDADANQVKEIVEGQGFVLLEQEKDTTGSQWQKYGKGAFSGFQCDITVAWQAKSLSEITIQSTEGFLLGTNVTYPSLVSRFSEEYGQPQEKDRYMLKSFPGVWVEWTKWVVTQTGTPAFTVTIEQNSPADGPNSREAVPAKISLSFKSTRN